MRHLIDRFWAWAATRRDQLITNAIGEPAPPDRLAPLDPELMRTIRELVD